MTKKKNDKLEKDGEQLENEKEIVKIVIKELQERNLIHEVKNSYKNTEYLLNNYNLLLKSIKDMEHQIDDLKTYGLPKHQSGKAAHIISNTNTIKIDDDKIIEARISELRQSTYRTRAVINMVNSILYDLQDDKYYEIIKLIYFEKKSYEEIAEYLDCDISTVSRNKNRLINTIKIRLFPNTFINELGY